MTEQQQPGMTSESAFYRDGVHRICFGGATDADRDSPFAEPTQWTLEPAPYPVPVSLGRRDELSPTLTPAQLATLTAIAQGKTTPSARRSRPALVVLESPYAGDVEANLAYARACVADSLARGEAPIASHLLYTQPGILDDADPAERALGIAAGHAWIGVASKLVVYTDLGISRGMEAGIAAASSWAHEVPVEYRTVH